MDDDGQDSISFSLDVKFMVLLSVAIFFAGFLTFLFHAYVHWFRHPHHDGGNSSRRRRLIDSTSFVGSRGLDLRVMNSLPTFVYESKSRESPLYCAVCLSEFEDNETGRILPGCEHCFHVGCIDMWFQSHPDCPLCRARVKIQAIRNPVEDPDERIISIGVAEDTGPESSSGLEPTGESDGVDTGCSSSSSRAPEVPRLLTGPMGQDPVEDKGASNSGGNLGSGIKSGPEPPVKPGRVLKRWHSI